MPRDVDLVVGVAAVQALVEQEVGVGLEVGPGREGAGFLAVDRVNYLQQ